MSWSVPANPAQKRPRIDQPTPTASPSYHQGPARPNGQMAQPRKPGPQVAAKSWSLIPGSDDPAPLYYPLAHLGCQAKHTTFPSRLQLGTTGLVQPLFTIDSLVKRNSDRQRETSPSGYDTPSGMGTPAYGAATGTDLGKRVRKVVNYAEIEARNEEVEESDDEDDDSQDARGGSARQRLLAQQKGRLGGPNGTATPIGGAATAAAMAARAEAERKRKEEEAIRAKMYGDGRVYLGQRPPAKYVKVQRRDRRTTHVSPTMDEVETAAEQLEGLVPIRVEFETDTLKIRDRFVWNLKEKHISPEVFAHAFCVDLDIPRDPYMARIVEQIKSQIEDSSHLAEVQLVPDDSGDAGGEGQDQDDGPLPDLRVIVHLDVQLDLLHLSDRLEWDLASPLTPELFAAQYILDLSLPPSCAPLIAHAIHEELLRCKRECLEHGLVGTTSASTARDVEGVNKRAPKRMEGIWREWGEATAYGPRVSELTPAEIEENEIERERAVKRAKRDVIRPGFRRR